MKKRFKGKFGEEYNLFKLACPHFDELQNEIRYLIKNWITEQNLKRAEILEIGCGHGYTTKIILSQDDKAGVTSIDNEPVMLKQTNDNLQIYI